MLKISIQLIHYNCFLISQANWVQDNINAGRGSLSRNSSEVFNLIESNLGTPVNPTGQRISPTPGASASIPQVFDKRPALPASFVAQAREMGRRNEDTEIMFQGDEQSQNSSEWNNSSYSTWTEREVEDVMPNLDGAPSAVAELRNLNISNNRTGIEVICSSLQFCKRIW